MGFLDFLSGSTPAGVISETGQKVISGVFDGVGAMIDRFHLSETDKQDMKMELARMQLDAYKTQISDIQSARQMQMTVQSPWPGILTCVIVGGYFGLLAVMIIHGIPSTKDPGGEVLLTLIGVLAGAVPTVLAFWFGTTQGGRAKDQLLAESVPSSSVSMVMRPPSS
jgi:uncharacterized membrane protein YeaQ/YmgE (transglycosylase-associated protein family)